MYTRVIYVCTKLIKSLSPRFGRRERDNYRSLARYVIWICNQYRRKSKAVVDVPLPLSLSLHFLSPLPTSLLRVSARVLIEIFEEEGERGGEDQPFNSRSFAVRPPTCEIYYFMVISWERNWIVCALLVVCMCVYACLHSNYEGLILTPVGSIVLVLICFSSYELRFARVEISICKLARRWFCKERKEKKRNKNKNKNVEGGGRNKLLIRS